MTIQVTPSDPIVLNFLYLRNSIPQSGKTLTYEIKDDARNTVRSGSLTEDTPGNPGWYTDTWSSPGYTSQTNLDWNVIESSKIIAHEKIVITDTQTILDRVDEADKFFDGKAY